VNVAGQHFRTIWLKPDDEAVVQLIDQRFLPHRFVIEEIRTVEQMATAIREMHVRGAGLIGASAGYGMYLAAIEAAARRAARVRLVNSELICAIRPPHASRAALPSVGPTADRAVAR